MGVLTNPVQDFMTPVSRSLVGKVFANARLTRVANTSMMVSMIQRGEACANPVPFSLCFYSFACSQQKNIICQQY